MKPLRSLLLLLTVLLGFSAFAQKNDTIVLYNGDRIVGEVKNLSYGKVKYSTNKISTIYVEWDGVRHLITDKKFTVKSSGGSVYYASFGRAQGPANTLILSTDTFELDKTRIVEITRLRTGFWHRLDGSVSLGLNQTKANDLVQWTFGFTTTYRTKFYLSQLDVNSIITDQEEKDTQRKQDAAFMLMRYIGGKGVAGGRMAAEQNSELGLELRSSVTITGGVDLLHTNRNMLLPTAGIMVNREKSSGNGSVTENLEGAIQAMYKAFNYDSPQLSIDVLAQFFPSFTVKDRYRFNSDLSLRYEIFKDLFLELSFYYQYDSKPPNSDAVSSDYGTNASIGYSW